MKQAKFDKINKREFEARIAYKNIRISLFLIWKGLPCTFKYTNNADDEPHERHRFMKIILTRN